jgi:hypothetical protein
MGNVITMIYVKILIFLNMSCAIIAEYLNFNKCVNEPILVVVDKKKDSNNNMRRTSSSSHNLCQYDHYSKDFECHRIGLSPNIENSLQTRLHCEACRVKLFHNRQRYFAFDKEYCPNCWRTISYKIVNNYP